MLPTDKRLEHRTRMTTHLQFLDFQLGMEHKKLQMACYYLAGADLNLKASYDPESEHQTVKDKKQASQETDIIETIAVGNSAQSEADFYNCCFYMANQWFGGGVHGWAGNYISSRKVIRTGSGFGARLRELTFLPQLISANQL